MEICSNDHFKLLITYRWSHLAVSGRLFSLLNKTKREILKSANYSNNLISNIFSFLIFFFLLFSHRNYWMSIKVPTFYQLQCYCLVTKCYSYVSFYIKHVFVFTQTFVDNYSTCILQFLLSYGYSRFTLTDTKAIFYSSTSCNLLDTLNYLLLVGNKISTDKNILTCSWNAIDKHCKSVPQGR
jgi:hypothetical protein